MKTATYANGPIRPNRAPFRIPCRSRLSAAGIVLAVAAALTVLSISATTLWILRGTPAVLDTASQVVESFGLSTLSLRPSGSPDRLSPAPDPRVDLRFSPSLPIVDPSPGTLLLPRPQNP